MRETLYFNEVVSLDATDKQQIMVKLDTRYHSGPARKIAYEDDTSADGNLLPLRDLQRAQPGIDNNELVNAINLT